MKEISVRRIKEPNFSEGFSIRNIGTLLSKRDLVQELHRHNFFSFFPVFAQTQIEKAGITGCGYSLKLMGKCIQQISPLM